MKTFGRANRGGIKQPQMTRIIKFASSAARQLEDVLQSKLKDARRLCRSDLSEGVAVKSERVTGCGICSPGCSTDTHGNKAVGEVKCFCPHFQLFSFTKGECSRHGHIERPCGRPGKAIPTD